MSREGELSKNFFILAIGTFLPKLAYFVTLPIITGSLSKGEYGTYELIATCISFLIPVATLQLQTAAFRFLIDCREDGDERTRVISNSVGFTFCCSLLTNLVLAAVLTRMKADFAIIVSLYFFVEMLVSTIRQIVRGLSKNKLYTVGTAVKSVINLILIIWVIYFESRGLNGVLFAAMAADLCELTVLLIKGDILRHIKLSFIDIKEIKALLKYSLPMVPNSLCIWVINYSDRYMLTYFMGTEANAVYSAATKIPIAMALLQIVFVYAWQENASLYVNDEDASRYYSDMFDRCYRVLCGAMAGLLAVTPLLFKLLIRGDYADSYRYISILVLAELFHGLTIYSEGIYIAKKRTKELAGTVIVPMIVNVLINFFLITRIGILAAALSTLVSFGLMAVIRLVGACKYSGMKINYFELFGFMLVEIVFCAVNYLNNLTGNILLAIVAVLFAVFINRELIKNSGII